MRETLFFCVLAAVPGLYSWLAGRELAGRIDDPVLPERLNSHRQRVAWLSAAVLLVTPLLVDGWWPLLMLVLLTLAGGFPLRRRLREETWSLPAYLFWLARLALGFGAFWIVIAVAPWFVLEYDRPGGPLAIGFLTVLVVWQAFHWRVAFTLVRARPLADPELSSAFEVVRARSRVPRIDVWVAGDEARVVQALALPGLRRHSVLFWPDLLRLLDRRESAAVFAHEVAHLEEYGSGRTAASEGTQLAAVAGACLVVPSFAAGEGYGWLVSVWALAVIVFVLRGATARQKHEADSDRRAVELCGDPDALASGLEKLTTASLIPRRWTAAQRASATHPDLAERLRAIRTQSAQTEPPAIEPVVVRSAEGASALVVEEGRIHLLEGLTSDDLSTAAREPHSVASAVTTLPTDELLQIELVARGNTSPQLYVRHTSGRQWKLNVAADGVIPLQRALERIPQPVTHTPWLSVTGYVVAGVATGLAWSAGGASVCMLLLGASLFFCQRAMIVAAAVGLVVHALLNVVAGGDDGSILSFLLAGACMSVVAVLERKRTEGPLERRTLAIAALVAANAMVFVWYSIWTMARESSTPWFVIEEALVAAPGAVVLPVAIGIFLAFLAERWVRAVSVASVAVAAVAFVLLLSRSLRDDLPDPFGSESRLFERVTVNAVLEREVELPGQAGRVRLWPDADGFAIDLARSREERRLGRGAGLDRRMRTFHVERGGDRFDTRAIDLVLLAEGRMLVLRSADGRPQVELLANSGSETLWSTPISTRRIAGLLVDRLGRWQVTGAPYTPASLTVVSGSLAGPEAGTTVWGGGTRFPEEVAAVGIATPATAVLIEENSQYPGKRSLAALVLGRDFHFVRRDLVPLDQASEVLSYRGQIDCLPIDLSSELVLCRTDHGDSTRFWLYEPATGAVSAERDVAGQSWSMKRTSEAGVVATRVRCDTLLVHVVAGRAYVPELGLPCDAVPRSIDIADARLAIATTTGGESSVRLYSVKPIARAGSDL